MRDTDTNCTFGTFFLRPNAELRKLTVTLNISMSVPDKSRFLQRGNEKESNVCIVSFFSFTVYNWRSV